MGAIGAGAAMCVISIPLRVVVGLGRAEGQSAVDHQGVAGDVGGVIRADERDRGGNLLWDSLSAHRYLAEHRRPAVLIAGERGVVEGGVDPARTDAVAADAEAR